MSIKRSGLPGRNEALVCQALAEARRPVGWVELRRPTGLTKGTFGRALIRCVEKGWIKIGGTVRDHRLVQLFELNLQTVSVNRIGDSFVVTRTEKLGPIVTDRLKKLEVVFAPHGPAMVRRHILKPVAHHPDNVEVWARPTVGMHDGIARNTTNGGAEDWKRIANWQSPRPPLAEAQHRAMDKAMTEDSAKHIGTPPCTYCRAGWSQPCLHNCNCALCREQLRQVCS